MAFQRSDARRSGCGAGVKPRDETQDLGHWRSDAYLRYVRSRRSEVDQWTQRIASADTDDFETDYVAVDDFDFDESDLE